MSDYTWKLLNETEVLLFKQNPKLLKEYHHTIEYALCKLGDITQEYINNTENIALLVNINNTDVYNNYVVQQINGIVVFKNNFYMGNALAYSSSATKMIFQEMTIFKKLLTHVTSLRCILIQEFGLVPDVHREIAYLLVLVSKDIEIAKK